MDEINKNRVFWIEYHDKKILYLDYSDMDGDIAAKTFMNYIPNMYVVSDYNSVLSLSDYTNFIPTVDFMKKVKEVVIKTREQDRKGAAIGIDTDSGIILFGLVNCISGGKYKHFKTREQALSWLLK